MGYLAGCWLTSPDGSVQRSAAEQEGDIRVVLGVIEPRLIALKEQLSDLDMVNKLVAAERSESST